MSTLLQVALDLIELEKAITIAKQAVKAGADIIEAGTPLIKSEGMRAVKTLRNTFREKTIVADMKTMDVGWLEAELAISSGANIVTVMALAPVETIISAVEKAHELGGEVMVDLMNVNEPLKKCLELKRLGVDYVCLHVGIDVQRKLKVTAADLADKAFQIKSETGLKVAVAGGINEKTARIFAGKVDIVIVGGAIIKSKNPYETTLKILKSLGRTT